MLRFICNLLYRADVRHALLSLVLTVLSTFA
jgi:hypothetical protein